MRTRVTSRRRDSLRPLTRFLSLLALAMGIVLGTASSASAVNAAPNPGFEFDCGSPTKACAWLEQNDSFAQVQRDVSITHDGSLASYKTKVVGAFLGAGGFTDCLSPEPAGPAFMSFWYWTTSALVIDIRMTAYAWDTSTCNGSASGTSVGTSAPIADGQWHQVFAGVTALSDEGFTLNLEFTCFSTCANAQVNFDDVVFDQNPTAVVVSSIHARRTREGVLLRWQTASEQALLGFNLYRRQKGTLVKLNRTLIPSGFGFATSGHAYSWLDRTAPRGNARYRLQAVNLDGTRSWVGNAGVT